MVIVSRTVTPLVGRHDDTWQRGPSRPVADFGTERAYVLLGDPGSGKTTTFEEEAKALPDRNHYITARDFWSSNLDRHQEWRMKTLFIDGLDEVRAGRSNAARRLLINSILKLLEQLDYPRVRISCRIADWFLSDPREFANKYPSLQVLLLDPLTKADARQIIRASGQSADALMDVARDGGIDHFLTNPQLLESLIISHADTKTARSKAALLNNACQTMVLEHNRHHQEAAPDPPALRPDDMLSAAGRLSALLLLTGKEYISLYRTTAGDPDDCLVLDRLEGDQSVLRCVLRTKLFSGAAPDQMAPVHSLVAEYLAGRYLADQINRQDGLSAARVLALMCGPNNEVVPTLQGVAAWFATFLPSVRRSLIKSDPWSVLAYGDPSCFDSKDKELILKYLATHTGTTMYFWDLSDMTAAGLVGPDTIRTVRHYITNADRSEKAQQAMAILFRGVAARNVNQHHMTVEELLDVATEPSWSSRVRSTALMAAVAAARRSNAAKLLLRVLDDIQSGKVSDIQSDDVSDNQLRGLLLQELYPDTVTPARIWHYYPDDTGTGVSGFNELFWYCLADPERSKSDHIATLLDGLVEQRHRFYPDLGHLDTTAWKLLERGVESYGAQIPIQRLYDWIEAVAWDGISKEWRPPSDDFADPNADGSLEFRRLSIQPWMAEHPKIQLALLREFCRRQSAEDLREQWGTFEQLVCGRAYPADYLLWCLEHAVHMADDEPRVARVLIDQADANGWQRIASLPLLRPVIKKVSGHPVLNNRIQELFVREEQIENAVEKQQSRQLQRDRELADSVHKHAAELSTGNGPPELLHQLAQAYLGVGQYHGLRNRVYRVEDYFLDWDVSGPPPMQESKGPMDRLRQALADAEEATAIAVRALRLFPSRDDLPDPLQVLELDNRRHWLVYPILAAVAEADARGEDVCAKSDDWIARSLVCHALTPLGNRNVPAWVGKLLACRPEAVADALVLVGKSQIQRDVWDGEHLKRMAAEDRYGTVAASTAVRLARSFPTRCNGSQAGALQTVLRVALRHGASAPDVAGEVLELVESKSAVPGMDVKQMATWLGVGLRLEFEEYVARAIEFLDGGKIERLWHLVEFLAGPDDDDWGWPASQDVKALGDLTKVVADRCEPWSWTQRDVHTGTPLGVSERDSAELAAEKLVEGWAGMLARNPDVAAGEALQGLADSLDAWRHVIEPKYRDWQINRRVAEYEIPGVDDVQRTLRNGPPANPADLAALLVDKLEELAVEIRNGNTDDWKQYWKVDKYGRARAKEHRPEDTNRDALLSDLRRCLPTGVNAEPEGHYAKDKRADIRVAWQDHAIPVEIKKNSHRQVWSAIEKQLIAKYTRDPGASGFGVYLVLWFGAEYTRVVPPCGRRSKPSNPAEMKRYLEEGLTDEQRRTISVVVIDVSRP